MSVTWTAVLTTRATIGTDPLTALLGIIAAPTPHSEGEWVAVSSPAGSVAFRPGADARTFRRRTRRALDLFAVFVGGQR